MNTTKRKLCVSKKLYKIHLSTLLHDRVTVSHTIIKLKTGNKGYIQAGTQFVKVPFSSSLERLNSVPLNKLLPGFSKI